MAPNIGTRNAAHSSHRLTVAGRIRSTIALIAAAPNRAHPINALAGYQIAQFDCVEAVLKPKNPFGGTTHRLGGILVPMRRHHDVGYSVRFCPSSSVLF